MGTCCQAPKIKIGCRVFDGATRFHRFDAPPIKNLTPDSDIKTAEAISKCSIGLKIKAGRGSQPQTYIEYFEDWTPRPNADIEFKGTF